VKESAPTAWLNRKSTSFSSSSRSPSSFSRRSVSLYVRFVLLPKSPSFTSSTGTISITPRSARSSKVATASASLTVPQRISAPTRAGARSGSGSSRKYGPSKCVRCSRPYLKKRKTTRPRATSGRTAPSTIAAPRRRRAAARSALASSASCFSSARTAETRGPSRRGAFGTASGGKSMRTSTKVAAGRSSTASTTTPSGRMLTSPHRGPWAQARTSSPLTPPGGVTVARTWSAGTSQRSPTSFQYSSAVSSHRFAAPRTRYSMPNRADVSDRLKHSSTRTLSPSSATKYVPGFRAEPEAAGSYGPSGPLAPTTSMPSLSSLSSSQ